jgi:protein involved in polysaccharide export with SLBB domain
MSGVNSSRIDKGGLRIKFIRSMEELKLKRSAFLLMCVALLSIMIVRVFADDYRIKPGDNLGITVMDEQDLTKHVIVDPQGSITLPLVNQVVVANMTLPQATKDLTQRLAVFIKSPQVTVELVETVKMQVNVSGEVRSPGLYTLTSSTRLMDAVTQAGGYTQSADLSKVAVTHSDGSVTAVNLNKFLQGTDVTTNIPLTGGDTVVIPARQVDVIGTVSVLGAVHQPGERPLMKGTTFTEAIMAAGGPTELADTMKITIRHQGSAETSPVNYASAVGGDHTSDIELKPGDVIYVDTRAELGYYIIQGAVVNPGRYELKDKTNLTDTIAIAGGIKGKAKLKKVLIVRNSGGATQTLPADVSGIMEGTTPNVPIKSGDSIYIPGANESPVDFLKVASLLASIGWLLTR